MIRLAEVSCTYRSWWHRAAPVRALDRVSLDIAAGSAVGVIGLSGAGKTTLLRVLLGYLRPRSGAATIDGMSPRAYVERNGMGYVPERVAIPGRWSVEGALQAYALLGDAGGDGPERVAWALRRLGLEELRGRRVSSLSKGNLQRLAIAQALLCDREVLVLDEPTDGLDPVWIAELRGMIAEWRAANAARVVMIASHDLHQIERVADRVVVLHAGRVLTELAPASEGAGTLEDRFLRLIREEAAAA